MLLEPLGRATVHPEYMAVRMFVSEPVAVLNGNLGFPDDLEHMTWNLFSLFRSPDATYSSQGHSLFFLR